MENQPIRDPRVLEALEACRPGSDDLADPSLAFLAAELAAHPELEDVYRRLQRLDGKLALAYRDVPVPERLDERILARLEAARTESPSSEEGIAPAPAPPVESPAPAAVGRMSRRTVWAAVGGIGVVAAAVLLMVTLNGAETVELTHDRAAAEAMQRFSAEVPEEDWRSTKVDSPPARYPFSREVLPVANMRWAPIRGFLGRNGVVYEMVAPNGTRVAVLYVVAGGSAKLPSTPARDPMSTAGRSASAWQSGGLLYVLVVNGSPQQYRQFLNLRQGPVT